MGLGKRIKKPMNGAIQSSKRTKTITNKRPSSLFANISNIHISLKPFLTFETILFFHYNSETFILLQLGISRMEGKGRTTLPPGFRFHPTDEELIVYYLTNQVASRPCPVSIIPEVNIYKFDPWDLPNKSELTENEWYFFTPRDRKYPNGVRPNRSTVSGYWKATGTDKAINSGAKYVGVKKSLVFYTGKPPKGTKTEWIMHEYCLTDKRSNGHKRMGSMILDNWVLCRIYKKKKAERILELKVEESSVQTHSTLENDAAEQQLKFPRTFSFTQFLDLENMVPLSEFLGDTSYCPNFHLQNSLISGGVNYGGGDTTCQYASSENSSVFNF